VIITFDIKLKATDYQINLLKTMLTIAELAKNYDMSEQAVRRAFKVLVKLNKLKFGQDYFKRNFKDDKHFVYEIDPRKFETHYTSFAHQLGGHIAAPTEPKSDIKNENQGQSDIKSKDPLISTDIKDRYINTLETQMERKDIQIKHLQESVKLKDDLVIALNTRLLRLPEPKPQPEDQSKTGQSETTLSEEPLSEPIPFSNLS